MRNLTVREKLIADLRRKNVPVYYDPNLMKVPGIYTNLKGTIIVVVPPEMIGKNGIEDFLASSNVMLVGEPLVRINDNTDLQLSNPDVYAELQRNTRNKFGIKLREPVGARIANANDLTEGTWAGRRGTPDRHHLDEGSFYEDGTPRSKMTGAGPFTRESHDPQMQDFRQELPANGNPVADKTELEPVGAAS